ncbi:MAG TPA: hypothetical protein VKE94_09385, partial [Gemmataceae bacterium]|nr:hypothetical protein [Gemmataceae bacterium]
SKLLKQLKGKMTAEVYGPIKPIITVDNLIETAGKTVKGSDGGSLEVLEVVEGDDDQVTVKLAIDPPNDFAPGMAVAGVGGFAARAAVKQARFAGAGGGGGGGPPAAPPAPALPGPAPALPARNLLPPAAAPAAGAIVMGVPASAQHSELALLDAQGKPIQTTRHVLSYRAGEKGYTHVHEFSFKLPKEKEAIKLVFSGRRIATIDVPFTLKDVPLP